MRTYPDALTFLLRDLHAKTSQQVAEAKKKLDSLYQESVWRINEAEAQMHTDFFGNYWQWLGPNYGERRSGDDSNNYSVRCRSELQNGDPSRPGQLYS